MLAREFDFVPAVDVLDGRAVRLAGGRRERITLEGGRPTELARRFAAEGASRIHLVDLDGAFDGSPTAGLVAAVAAASGLPVQVGGGYRSEEAIARALAEGADRVMVGTAAVDEAFVRRAVGRFDERLVVAIDARRGRVAVDGWTRSTSLTPTELARTCLRAGVARVLVTSTSRDGSLAGPDADLLTSVVASGPPVLAAGGIATLEDVALVRSLGCEGVVCGSALLDGRFTVAEALASLSRPIAPAG